MLHLLSINLGLPKPLPIGDELVRTGIFKTSVEHAKLSQNGFEGDAQADTRNHGGPDQAVYLYSADDYAWWSETLGRDLQGGTFGENLTLSSFGDLPSSADVRVGDRFEIGGVVLEATSPRIPCDKLAAKMGDMGFVKRFAQAERPGVYTRVLQTGSVRIGDEVSFVPNPEEAPTMRACVRWFYEKRPDPAALQKALRAPLGVRLRRHLEGKLSRER